MSRRPVAARVREIPLRRPLWVLLAVVVLFVVLTPFALQYGRSINYAGSASDLSGTQSQTAANLLAEATPAQSTLLVVVPVAGLPVGLVENETLGFQANVTAAHLPYVSVTASAYSAYAGFLDGVAASELGLIRGTYANVSSDAGQVYGFPAQFLAQWTSQGGTRSTLNSSFAAAGGAPTGYDASLLAWLLGNVSGASGSPAYWVQDAVAAVAPGYFSGLPDWAPLVALVNVSSYPGSVPLVAEAVLGGAPWHVPAAWVLAAVAPGDFGTHVVEGQGLAGAPSYLTGRFLSPDGAVELVTVTFSVPDSFRTGDGTYPAQAATPTLRGMASASFGPGTFVTGPGASAYDTQQLEAGAGAFFGLIFVFLALAVALTLRSWIAPLLALVVVSLSEVIGYLAIEVTGALVGKVDFTVTYTLTAVTLGVATDYLLFLAYRYREELAKGVPHEQALETATRTSGFAILVSAITVGVGLGTLSFLSGLATWGPVLFITVVSIGVLEVALLPALLRLIGPRIFVKRWLRPASPPAQSVFYRAAARSTRRPMAVAAIALVIAVPAVAGFVLLPTSYDFSGSLPASFPSATGQNLLQDHFGANLLYPSYVIVHDPAGFTGADGNLTTAGAAALYQNASELVNRTGVSAVDGPFVTGHNLTASTGASAFVFGGGQYAYFVVYSSYTPYSSGALSLVSSLRADPYYTVGGLTSSVLDQQAINSVQFPELELLLTLFIGAILGLAFRSLAAPLISLSGVFLSIGATTGILYLIATYVLHQSLIYLIPLVLFVILLSLGNDYTVFLLARIREERRSAGPTEGIRRGIAGSGVVVSALGIILAVSLGSLALQPLSFLQQVGLAFVVSLLLDTFLVRPFYFPAMLRLADRVRERRAAGGLAPGGDHGIP